MFVQPDVVVMLEGSPPSQAVLDQRPQWLFLAFALGATLLMRMVAFDILGGLLCGLLLLIAVLVMRDGMSGLPKFGLLFGMMCGVNCAFYLLPVISGVVSGRSERRVVPVEAVRYKDMHQLTYTLTVRTTPFFDADAGTLYNVQSVGMLMMPMCMLLGAYLGITGHQEVQRIASSLLPPDDGLLLESAGFGPGRTAAAGMSHADARQQAAYGAAVGRFAGAQQHAAAAARNGLQRLQAFHSAFQGRAHKLGQ
mmetsp:Transcript_101242/g.264004  ORF Transcript_101242/g.264004 Transcript_101242/m.264004 type:complete len:252 (+) Transcript_101242:145-900(+)